MKNVLVIGGSYFIGRIFVAEAEAAGTLALSVLNRGTYPLGLPDVHEHVCDRRDAARLISLCAALKPDVIVDFCAEEPGDVRSLLRAVRPAEQYILISSCSVYDPDAPSPKREDSPLIERGGDDPVLTYAYNKRRLEAEAIRECAEQKIALTILRPAFVYGPFNYAPRERFYFQCLIDNQPILVPTDAGGRFQFVFVKDIAAFLLRCIGNEAVHGRTFNLAAPEVMNYPGWTEVLEKVHGRPLDIQPVTVADVYRHGLPLPFPLDTDERYDGTSIASLLSLPYTSLESGMRETYAVYMQAFGPGNGG